MVKRFVSRDRSGELSKLAQRSFVEFHRGNEGYITGRKGLITIAVHSFDRTEGMLHASAILADPLYYTSQHSTVGGYVVYDYYVCAIRQ